MLGMDLVQLREKADKLGKLPALENDFQACEVALKQIDANASNAMDHIRDYYFTRHLPLSVKVTGKAGLIIPGLPQV